MKIKSLLDIMHEKNQHELEELLLLEKERRGLNETELVFVGMANIASYYWCAMKSLLKSREQEMVFFASYLYDRINYSFKFGFIKKMPENRERLLEIGDMIKFSDIEKLLQERAEINQEDTDMFVTATIIDKKSNNKVVLFNPDLPQEERKAYEKIMKVKIGNIEDFPLIRGNILETSKAERYPSIRWNFVWDKYVVVGVPDGITDSFVYEFKTTRNRSLMHYLKPIAFTQADLYGYFFKRKKKRVQIYIVDEKKSETWENRVDPTSALKALENFKRLDEGWIPPSPKPWKCKVCEFKDVCELYEKHQQKGRKTYQNSEFV